MSKTTEITCDECGKDLKLGNGTPGFRYVLHCEPLPQPPGPVLDVLVYPEIEDDCHFCNLRHLFTWLERQGC